MERLSWNNLAILVIVLCHVTYAAPNLRIKRDDTDLSDVSDLNPIASEESVGDGVDRDKRKIPDVVFAPKNAILGFVFGRSKRSPVTSSNPSKSNQRDQISTTTDDTPDFDRAKVSLELPDQLFATSFATITNVSKTFGDLIMSSARRFSQFVQFFKPVLGSTLTVKGYRAKPSTTSKPNEI